MERFLCLRKNLGCRAKEEQKYQVYKIKFFPHIQEKKWEVDIWIGTEGDKKGRGK